MLNPTSASKSPLSSRVALPIALLMAGVFGLAISVIQPPPFFEKTAAIPAAELGAPPVGAPKIPEPPSLEDANADLVQFCSRHVTDKRSFVVFRRGTCVVINEPSKNPVSEARAILARCTDPNARFVSEATRDGDLIVAFKDPVFHRFSAREMETLKPKVEEMATVLMTPGESVAAGDGWIPPVNARVGLLARRKLLEDAADAVPIKVIRARDRAMASR